MKITITKEISVVPAHKKKCEGCIAEEWYSHLECEYLNNLFNKPVYWCTESCVIFKQKVKEQLITD